MSKKLDQYRERLAPQEIAAGMNAARDNAERLLSDAKILFKHDSFARALALAALSIEESGKMSILRGLALARSPEEARLEWKAYRSHTSKNRWWPFLDFVKAGARKLGDFRALVQDSQEHPFLLDQLKQIAFYTDCLGKKHWSVPDAVVDKELAQQILLSAEALLPKRAVCTREIELWVEHLGPVWKGPMEVMETALISWHRKMCEEGLALRDPTDMEKFILGSADESAE